MHLRMLLASKKSPTPVPEGTVKEGDRQRVANASHSSNAGPAPSRRSSFPEHTGKDERLSIQARRGIALFEQSSGRPPIGLSPYCVGPTLILVEPNVKQRADCYATCLSLGERIDPENLAKSKGR